MTIMIDPPMGYLYGFPKAIPEDRKHDIIQWLIDEGYPEWMITLEFSYRAWEEIGSSEDV